MTRCIVSVGTHGWFVRGVERLEKSLRDVGWPGAVMTWKDSYPLDSPSQEEVDHGFKAYAMLAAQKAGYSTVMWLDASVMAVADPTPLFERAEADPLGLFFVQNGMNAGQWSSDASLRVFGLSREQALEIKEVATGFVCLDLRKAFAEEVLLQWHSYTLDGGVAYNGADSNMDGSVSSDPRVKGHRHDQTVMAFLLGSLGVRAARFEGIGESLIDDRVPPRAGKLLTYQGM